MSDDKEKLPDNSKNDEEDKKDKSESSHATPEEVETNICAEGTSKKKPIEIILDLPTPEDIPGPLTTRHPLLASLLSGESVVESVCDSLQESASNLPTDSSIECIPLETAAHCAIIKDMKSLESALEVRIKQKIYAARSSEESENGDGPLSKKRKMNTEDFSVACNVEIPAESSENLETGENSDSEVDLFDDIEELIDGVSEKTISKFCIQTEKKFYSKLIERLTDLCIRVYNLDHYMSSIPLPPDVEIPAAYPKLSDKSEVETNLRRDVYGLVNAEGNVKIVRLIAFYFKSSVTKAKDYVINKFGKIPIPPSLTDAVVPSVDPVGLVEITSELPGLWLRARYINWELALSTLLLLDWCLRDRPETDPEPIRPCRKMSLVIESQIKTLQQYIASLISRWDLPDNGQYYSLTVLLVILKNASKLTIILFEMYWILRFQLKELNVHDDDNPILQWGKK